MQALAQNEFVYDSDARIKFLNHAAATLGQHAYFASQSPSFQDMLTPRPGVFD